MSDKIHNSTFRKPSALSSTELSTLYDQPYYTGKTSGYPAEGYQSLRDIWDPWLEIIRQIKAPPGRFLDLGGAYGYLAAAARQNGYSAFNVEISSFALEQEPDHREFLIRADAQRPPFSAASFDVIAVFDVLEHLFQPQRCLEQAIRMLKPDGILIGATPDPMFFDRKEETHFYERPPSFWLNELKSLGFETQFRFSVDPYNFQFIASPRENSISSRLQIFQHDYISDRTDFLEVSSASDLHFEAKPRWGWKAFQEDSRSIEDRSASIYLLNMDPFPVRAKLILRIHHSPEFSTLRLRFNSSVLREINLSSEKTIHDLEVNNVLIPSGGHHLIFEVIPGGPSVSIGKLRFEVQRASETEITESLPFDLYQRYRLASDLAIRLSSKSLLDVGGVMGDRDGHIATIRDFFGSKNVSPTLVSTDSRQCDHPDHVPVSADEQPFGDGSFEIVLSLDVLEHIPGEGRISYLTELDRLASRWLIIGAPFSSPETEEAEDRLSNLLDLRFLKEHRELGLPEESLLTSFFGDRGYRIREYPSGFLPNWIHMQVLTQLVFSLRDSQSSGNLNRLYNQKNYLADLREPSYRKIFLISKDLDAELPSLSEIQQQAPDRGDPPFSSVPFIQVFERVRDLLQSRQKALHDTQFLVNARQEHIKGLIEERDALLKDLQEKPLWKIARERRAQKRNRRDQG